MDDAASVDSQALTVRYFDGRSSRPREVEARLVQATLRLSGPDVDRTIEARRVQWPERTRRGPRIAQLPDGGSLQSDDGAAWDEWVRSAGHGESVVVRLQQSWRGVLVSLLLLVVVSAAGYVWGLPWAARAVADRFPDGVEQQIGETVLAQVDEFVKPSQLSAQEQQAIEQAWQRVLRAHSAAQAARGVAVRPSRLLIRASEDIGPNALALPGGTMLLTDDMARLLQHDTEVIAGVLAHELGHVQHRHGVRMLVQVGVLGFVTSTLWGDYSGVLATVPLWLGQAHYSREAEREADAYSVTVLRDAGLSPAVMTRLFERFALFKRCGDDILKPVPAGSAPVCLPQPASGEDDEEKGGFWGLGFASHPADEDRIAFFRDAAR
ncbi:M48 family metallopeptidase [Hydrogenophaga luteola]|uniref:M48 family metallopeptidase n=1 Tax=Hydrogenophaga luteola TaxID=1591122 RepID=A0ABV7W1F8_9BURK